MVYISGSEFYSIITKQFVSFTILVPRFFGNDLSKYDT